MPSATTSWNFDILAKGPVKSAVLCPRVTHYKPIAPVDQSHFEIVIPGDAETYVDLDIHMSVWGKIVAEVHSSLERADSTTVFNNLLRSFFSQCSVTLKGDSVS
jgi:hypothetical protein